MAANVNSYISAGNAAVKNAYQSLAAARDNSPNQGEIAMKGMRARAKEKMAAQKADASVQKAKDSAEGYIERTEISTKSKLDAIKADNKQKMAGKLTAAAGMIAMAAMPGPEQIKPRATDYSRTEALYRERLGEAESNIKKYSDPSYRSELDKEFDALNSGVDRSLQNVDSATGAGAPVQSGSNVFVTGSTGRGTGPHLDARVWSHKAGGWIKPTGLYEQHITGPQGQKLSDYGMSSGYGNRAAPVPGASTFHVGEDWLTPEGTSLNINLPQVQGHHGRKHDTGGGYMSGYQLPDPDLELHLLHGQRLGHE